VNKKLEKKLKALPVSSGVYFHKSKSGEIIYVGKAAVLKNRVKQYFQSSKSFDNKTLSLVNEIEDTDWVETETEIDALFLESEMVKRYKPRYNILLRDDRSQMYVRINSKDDFPHVSFTRNPADDGAEYFGPYYNGYALKKALRYLRRIFPYYINKPNPSTSRASLSAHIGLEPQSMSSQEYKKVLRQLISYIKGNRAKIIKDIEVEMKSVAQKKEFERATILRNQLSNLRELKRRISFGDSEFLDISKDQALGELTKLLGLEKAPARIEGYDISHMSGTNVVASMVVFTNGVSDRSNYRKFKVQEKNDDFDNMRHVMTRRFSQKNVSSWGLPKLVLIDGGKGQLSAATSALQDNTQVKGKFVVIGIAKKDEQIVINNQTSNVVLNKEYAKQLNGYVEYSDGFVIVSLPKESNVVKLLQRVRDESHRFAVSYHTVLKRAKSTKSLLDDIPGIGSVTKSKLVKKFGSVRALKDVSQKELALVIGADKARSVYTSLH